MRTTFLLLLTLLACGRSHEPQAQPAPANSAAAATSELTDSLVLTTLFGQALRSENPSSCQQDAAELYAWKALDSTRFSTEQWERLGGKDSICYRVGHVEQITEDGLEKRLVLLKGVGETCHICPGVVDAAIFSTTSSGWKLDTYQHNVAVFGLVGQPFDHVEVRSAGTDAYLLALQTGSIWQGVTWRGFTAVLYLDGHFKEVLQKSVPLSSDNWNIAERTPTVPAYAYTASLSTQPGEGQCYDLIVHYQGTQLTPNGKGLQLFDREVRFEYRYGIYTTRQRLPE